MPRPSFRALVAFLVILPLTILLWDLATLEDTALVFKEGHAIETLSVLMLAIGIVLWFTLAGPYALREWQIPVLLALMAAREMDFDKRFGDYGLLKLRTYTGDAPMTVKLVGGAIILLALVASWRLLRRNMPFWWARLRTGHADALLILGAFVTGVVAKTLDGIGRKLGVTLPANIDMLAGRVEEVLELVCYWMLCIALARMTAVENRAAVYLDFDRHLADRL